MKKLLPLFFFTAILLLAAFLRLYLLGDIPAGLTNDETNLGYDAYSILLTGKDQWGQHLPIVFRGFGDYPPPFCRYITSLTIAIFGLTSTAVRLPFAFFGILFVAVIFFLARKIFNQKVAFITMALLALLPWAVGLSRVAIESSVAACLLTIGLFLFFIRKRISWMHFAATLFFALTMYTYSAYTLFTPLILLVLLVFVWKNKEIRVKYVAYILIFFVLLISPLFLTKNTSAASRFSQIGILHNINSIGLVSTLNDQRGACLTYIPSFLCKAENNKMLVFSTVLIKNYFSHFSVNFLFLSGTQTQFSILPQRGLDYLLSCILFIVGLFALSQTKGKQKLFLFFLLLSPLPDSLTGDGNYSRSFMMVPFLIVVEGYGAYILWEKIAKRTFIVKSTLLFLVACIALVGISSFFITYFTYFRDNYSRFSQYGYQPLMQYIAKVHTSYDRVYISSHLNDTKQYMYYLFYTKHSPLTYQTKRNVVFHEEPEGWMSIDQIDNIYFVSALPNMTTLAKLNNAGEKILLISHPTDFPEKLQPQFEVKDRIGYGLFAAESMNELIKYHLSHSTNQGIQQ
ncbi:MAG TPA: glycosyltransferase family 39 protein [Patescibacteria group bacterium]|nr:glycosyltransferase family 39 protein [Patescibacteria group bacterium]